MSESKGIFRRFLIYLVGGLVALEVIWLVGANWALGSDVVIGAINKKPEKLEVRWDQARTYIPGVIHVEGLSVKGTSKKQQWQVALDRVRVQMSLLALTTKTFRTYDVQGETLDFSLSKKDQPKVEATQEGTAAKDTSSPGEAAVTTATKKRPWRFGLHNIHIKGHEQITVLGFGVSGDGPIEADLSLELKGGPLSLQKTKMKLQNAEFHAQEEVVAHDLILGIDVGLKPFVPKKIKGAEVMAGLSGVVDISGTTKGAGVINAVLSRFKGFEVGSAEGGQLDAHLMFDEGVLMAGSDFKLNSSDGWIQLFDWKIDTELVAEVTVESNSDADGTKLSLGVENVEVQFEGSEGPVLQGADLVVLATSPGIDFASVGKSVGEAFNRIKLDLTGAEVADITRFPMPVLEEFSLQSGRVEVESHVDITPDLATGKVNISGQGIDALLGDVGMVGDMEIDINVESDEPGNRDFDILESFVKFDNFTMTKGDKEAKEKDKDWYFHILLKDGQMEIPRPGELLATIEIAMKDTRPIITIFSQDKSALKFFKGMLNFKDLTGTAQFEWSPENSEIKDLDIDSEGLKLKANVRTVADKTDGLMWVKFHGINIGIDMRGEKTDVRFNKPLEWYEDQIVSWGSTAAQPEAAAAN